LTVPLTCEPLAGRTVALTLGPSGSVVAHAASNSTYPAKTGVLTMSFPPLR
jgi:hypothetical protein